MKITGPPQDKRGRGRTHTGREELLRRTGYKNNMNNGHDHGQNLNICENRRLSNDRLRRDHRVPKHDYIGN